MKWAVSFLSIVVVSSLTGCAPLPAANPVAQTDKPPVATGIISFEIPADALGARDAQLSAILTKAGSLAAAQKQPTTILVTALAQDLPYINQAIWRGVPAKRTVRLSLENRTAGAREPYSVSIKPTQGG
ncbi:MULTISPECIES: hypothetical protein [unclassified Caballeronia]|uniref:hypothetical protein n=1 Tax=unclassified Caballeronia TaxID=2646786 RepID=UPI0028566B14|nr:MULTISPECIES: hypothetical protein [unclassified Caballeronia]MDR5771357.1 hypothetical protein [Caballeronia sp. LZ002]MDR5805119.1 hypothetical protein [Caballeronia sp. LZ001]MDR5846793.1 hypothetical protein [Caballeronia sp. LZ003]